MTALQKRLAVAGILLGLFLSALESTVVATAMPTIVASLGGLSIFSWVFSGYLLSSTVTMPLWGRLSDLHGRKRFFILGVSVFMAGSALCGLSRTMSQLVFFRFLQGMGAGAVLPLTFTIIGDIFSLEERAKMQGYFSGVWGVASLIGPWVGGLLVDHVSWRWIFYLNIPFGLLSLAMISIGLQGKEAVHGRGGSLDLGGTLTFTASVLSLLTGLSIVSQYPWVSGALFAAAAFFLWLYIRFENRAEHPLIPLKLFRIPFYRAAQGAGLFTGMAMFGTLSFIPLFMQSVLGSTATQAGQILTPFMLGWVIFSIAGARLLLKLGYRGVILTGSVLLLAGFALLLTLDGNSAYSRVMLCMFLQGAGMGFNMAPFMIGVQSAVPRSLLGAATSSTQFVRTIGGAVGVAVMGAALSHHLKSEARMLLLNPASQALGRVLEHPDSIIASAGGPGLPAELLHQARMQMAMGLKDVFVAGIVFAGVAFLACLQVPGGMAQAHVWKPDGEPGAPI